MSVLQKFAATSPQKSMQQKAYEIHYVYTPGQQIRVNPHLMPTSFYSEPFPKGEICPLFLCMDRRHDLSDSTMMAGTGTNNMSLRDFPIPPGIQAEEFMTAFNEKGAVILDSLTGVDPTTVLDAQVLLLPEGIVSLLATRKFLAEEAPRNIKASSFSHSMKELLEQTRHEMLNAISLAVIYQNSVLQAFEAGVSALQNTGFGRGVADYSEKEYYFNLEREIPAEIDASTLREQKKNVMQNETMLATTLAKLSEHIVSQEQNRTDPEVALLKQQLAVQAAAIEKLLARIPAVESESVDSVDKPSKKSKKD